jgi:hypothetical protein
MSSCAMNGRLPVGQTRFPVLAAIEVVHEPIVGRLAERAADSDFGRAAGGLAFVDAWEVRRAKWLREERRHAQQKRPEDREK